jgi:thiosulfate dehydrogenase
MKGFILGIVFAVVIGLCAAYLFLYLGKFPIGADNPPGALERSLANTAMDQYVDRNAPKQENPVEINSANLIDGAHEYEEHCAFCHGGARALISPMRTRFNPPVPQIVSRPPHDEDAHLFWVTKHGIRMTGMPSWDGILTDEEMWKIIAFVKHSKQLPPDVQAAWQKTATDEHEENAGEESGPEHHEHMHPPKEPAKH